MSVADKLVIIAENEQKVYEAGQKTEYDRFWDAYQNNGERTNYSGAFYGSGWTDDTFKPKYDIVLTKESSIYMFRDCYITNIESALDKQGVTFNLSGLTSASSVFYSARFTQVIPEVICTAATDCKQMFYACHALTTIRKLEVNENTTFINTFFQCNVLQNIEIAGTIGNGVNFQWSPLTHDSLMSIINALKDYSSDTGEIFGTIKLGPTNLAKLTAEELDLIEQKGWIYE